MKPLDRLVCAFVNELDHVPAFGNPDARYCPITPHQNSQAKLVDTEPEEGLVLVVPPAEAETSKVWFGTLVKLLAIRFNSEYCAAMPGPV